MPSGDFIGPAYEPDPVNAADLSQGYVNKPPNPVRDAYRVKYGRGQRATTRTASTTIGAEQPHDQLINEDLAFALAWCEGYQNLCLRDTVKLTKTALIVTKNGRTYRSHSGVLSSANNATILTPRTSIYPDG